MNNGFAYTYNSADDQSNPTETFNLISLFKNIKIKEDGSQSQRFCLTMEEEGSEISFEFRLSNSLLMIPEGGTPDDDL